MKQNGEYKHLLKLLEKHRNNSDYLSRLNIHIGKDNHEYVIKSIKGFGKRVIFCTGDRAMRNYGYLEIYLKLFKKYNFTVLHFDNISPNPTLQQMKEGVVVAKEFAPDFIFALGGGSVIDTAKMISIGLFGEIWDFVEKKQEIKKAVPLITSATTSGTGSHVTPYAVVTNTDSLEKKTLKNDLLLPKMSIVDLDIVQHMPDYITATTGFDVLCHASEVYTRNECTPIVEEFCIKALSLIREHLINSYNKDSIKNKLGMIYADIYAGIALALIGTHVPHAISHPISARFSEITHGQALAYVFAETSKKQIKKGSIELKNRFKHISNLLGGSSNFVRTTDNYVKLLNLSNSFSFTSKDCELIYSDTMGYRKPSVDRSPVSLTENEIREIINNSLLNI